MADTSNLIAALIAPPTVGGQTTPPTGMPGTPAPGTGTSIYGRLPAEMNNGLIQALRNATPMGNMNKGVSSLQLGKPNTTTNGTANAPWMGNVPKLGESSAAPKTGGGGLQPGVNPDGTIGVPLPLPGGVTPTIPLPKPGGTGGTGGLQPGTNPDGTIGIPIPLPGGVTPTIPLPNPGGGQTPTLPDYRPGPQSPDNWPPAGTDPTYGLQPAPQGNSNGAPVTEAVNTPYGPYFLKPGESVQGDWIVGAPAPTPQQLSWQDTVNSVQWDRASDPNQVKYQQDMIAALRAAGY